MSIVEGTLSKKIKIIPPESRKINETNETNEILKIIEYFENEKKKNYEFLEEFIKFSDPEKHCLPELALLIPRAFRQNKFLLKEIINKMKDLDQWKQINFFRLILNNRFFEGGPDEILYNFREFFQIMEEVYHYDNIRFFLEKVYSEDKKNNKNFNEDFFDKYIIFVKKICNIKAFIEANNINFNYDQLILPTENSPEKNLEILKKILESNNFDQIDVLHKRLFSKEEVNFFELNTSEQEDFLSKIDNKKSNNITLTLIEDCILENNQNLKKEREAECEEFYAMLKEINSHNLERGKIFTKILGKYDGKIYYFSLDLNQDPRVKFKIYELFSNFEIYNEKLQELTRIENFIKNFQTEKAIELLNLFHDPKISLRKINIIGYLNDSIDKTEFFPFQTIELQDKFLNLILSNKISDKKFFNMEGIYYTIYINVIFKNETEIENEYFKKFLNNFIFFILDIFEKTDCINYTSIEEIFSILSSRNENLNLSKNNEDKKKFDKLLEKFPNFKDLYDISFFFERGLFDVYEKVLPDINIQKFFQDTHSNKLSLISSNEEGCQITSF